MLATVTLSSHKSQVILTLFCLLLPANSAHLFWAHILSPAAFAPVTWGDPEPPLSTNDTLVTGGSRPPPPGPLDQCPNPCNSAT